MLPPERRDRAPPLTIEPVAHPPPSHRRTPAPAASICHHLCHLYLLARHIDRGTRARPDGDDRVVTPRPRSTTPRLRRRPPAGQSARLRDNRPQHQTPRTPPRTRRRALRRSLPDQVVRARRASYTGSPPSITAGNRLGAQGKARTITATPMGCTAARIHPLGLYDSRFSAERRLTSTG